jgi:tRNA-dihydrouridine synthase
MNIWDELTKPFFVLAPMDDVTDTVFRQVVADLAPPDLFFTEFVNVEALASKGREKTLPRLRLDGEKEHPIIAQIWGLNPENFYKAAIDITKMGYDGIDLNFGCPDKNVTRNGACSAFILPENRSKALEIIQATKEGAKAAAKAGKKQGSPLPVSAKTRLGFNTIDFTWHELLLQQNLAALTVHGRTKKQMSKVPADWDKIGEIREIRDKLAPQTKVIGNGDVLSYAQGLEQAKNYQLDGIMIGRGVFSDPYVFAKNSPWETISPQERLQIYRKHVELFAKTWQHNERKIVTLNKFCKIYINGFEGAKELREELMAARSSDTLLHILDTATIQTAE